MAQTGYTPILIYSSSTASNAPVAGNLTNSTLGSELAINITDGKLFYKDNANAVQVIAWKTTPTTAGGTGLTSYTAGDLLYYASGTALSKLLIGANKTILTSSGSAPQWSASLDTSQGGTGLTSYSQGDLLYYNSGTTLTALAKNTTATRYLSNTGTNNNPAWAQVDLTNGVTGVLPNANTTGATAATANTLLLRDGSGNGTVATLNCSAVSNSGSYQQAYGQALNSTTSGGSTSHMMSYQTWSGTANILVVGNTFGDLVFATGGGTLTERIFSGGDFLINQTSDALGTSNSLQVKSAGEVSQLDRDTVADGVILRYKKQGSTVGYISTNTYSLPSDERVKKNIVPISLGLEFLLDLEPVEYNTLFQDPENESRKNFGLKAQQVEAALQKHGKTVNDVTFLEKFEEYKEGESQYGLGYQNLVPVLIQAVHQLQAQIDELKGAQNVAN